MKSRWEQRGLQSKPTVASGIAVLVLTMVIGLRQAGSFQELELATYDRYLQWRPADTQWESPIVLIKILEEDIQRFGHPLTDKLLARILRLLLEAEPRAVGVDVFRDRPSIGRDRLASVIADNPNVVLIEGLLNGRIAPPEFIEDNHQVGFADIKLDPSGILRRGLLFLWDEDDNPYLSFALQLALVYLEDHGITLSPDPDNPRLVRLGKTTIERFRGDQGGYIRADDGGYQYLLDFRRGTRPFPWYSVSQVLDGAVPAQTLQGRIVVIGTASTSVQDQHETPLTTGRSTTEPMHGLEIHGHATDQLIRIALNAEAPTQTLERPFETLWILLWGLFGALLGIWLRSLWLLILATAGLVLPFATGYFMMRQGLWITAAPAALAYIGALGLSVAFVSYREHAERALIMQLFGQFVAPEVAKALWAQRDQFMEGGRPRPQELVATVMITDLQGYTLPSETMAPEKVMTWINSYIEAMTRIVDSHEGVVEDFAGDGIKVNFGVPIPRSCDAEIEEDARRAVQCALAMGEELSRLNTQWREQDFPTERLRIGILTGPVIAGSVGSTRRMSYTTVGDTVNTAARLESFDKTRFKADSASEFRILIGEATWKRLNGKYSGECVGTHKLPGRHGKVTIYRINDGEPLVNQ